MKLINVFGYWINPDRIRTIENGVIFFGSMHHISIDDKTGDEVAAEINRQIDLLNEESTECYVRSKGEVSHGNAIVLKPLLTEILGTLDDRGGEGNG